MKRAGLVLCSVLAAWLAVGAAAAQASRDLAVEQSASATVVGKGNPVTITVTVRNKGTEAVPAGIGVEMGGLGGGDKVTENPYLSAIPSQGSCNQVHGSASLIFCPIGELGPGTSMQITAVVRIEETMKHSVGFLVADESGQPSGAEYFDSNYGDDVSFLKISASSPPVLTGSPKIRFPGLPQGCVSGNFKLHVLVGLPEVKKVSASLFLGYDKDGVGQEWHRSSHGSKRLGATVPIQQLEEYRHPYYATAYKLKVKARIKGGARLKRTIEFQLC